MEKNKNVSTTDPTEEDITGAKLIRKAIKYEKQRHIEDKSE